MNSIQIFIIILLGILLIFFLFRKRLRQLLSFLITPLFILALCFALIATFWPAPYQFFAGQILNNNGVNAGIEQLDKSLNPTLNSVKNFGDQLQELFQGKPTAATTTTNQADFLHNSLYVPLQNFLADILRGFSLILSIALLMATLYAGFSLESNQPNLELVKRIKVLEVKLNTIEAAQKA